jgi:hypothetical protein
MKSHFLLLLIIVLTGCVANHEISGVFTKRKYAKGYFNNMAGEKPSVVSRQSKVVELPEVKQAAIPANMPVTATGIKNIKTAMVLPVKLYHKTQIISSIKIEHVSDEPQKKENVTEGTPVTSDINIQLRVSEMLIIIGGILFLFSLFFALPGISPLLLLGIGALMLVFGLLYFFDARAKLKPKTDTATGDTAYTTQKGMLGFTLVVIGVAAFFIFDQLLGAFTLSGSINTTVGGAFVAVDVLAALTAIGGFFICLTSLNKTDKYNSYALAGICIVLAAVLALVLLAVVK